MISLKVANSLREGPGCRVIEGPPGILGFLSGAISQTWQKSMDVWMPVSHREMMITGIGCEGDSGVELGL